MKVLKDNSKNNVVKVKKEIIPKTITTFCDNCYSELEITEEDTYIGWLGTRFITCRVVVKSQWLRNWKELLLQKTI